MFSTALNTLAKAKLVRNAKHKQLFKLVVAFNVTQTNKRGNYIFPQQKQCAYVSGDISIAEVANVMHNASKVLRTNNIVLVD